MMGCMKTSKHTVSVSMRGRKQWEREVESAEAALALAETVTQDPWASTVVVAEMALTTVRGLPCWTFASQRTYETAGRGAALVAA